MHWPGRRCERRRPGCEEPRGPGVLWCAAVVGAGLIIASPVRADVETLSLYQKTARASLVVRARALSSSTRRPEMRVLEVIKGIYHGDSLVIAPHERDVRDTSPWLRREVFSEGVESILFLAPYVDEFGRDEGPRTFSVLNADQGKVDIPAEGAEALLSAVRRFAAIQAMGQHDSQSAALRDLLGSTNPLLLEAALEECRRHRLALPEDLPALITIAAHPRPGFRSGALALIRQVVQEAGRSAGSGGGAAAPASSLVPMEEIFDRVAAVARFDMDASVRRAAVAALEGFGDEAALALLDRIGAADPSQMVRYEAQVAAHRLREKHH